MKAVCIGVASAAAAFAVAAPAQAQAPHLNKTTTVHVYPLSVDTGSLKPGYKIIKSYRDATCNPGSDIAASAYRCFAGNLVLDPCFALNGDLYCPTGPFLKSVIKVDTNQGGADSVGGKNRLWGIKLATGVTCEFADGARDSVGTHSVSYYCSKKGLALIDSPNHKLAVQTIRSVTYDSKGVAHLGRTYQIAELAYAAVPASQGD